MGVILRPPRTQPSSIALELIRSFAARDIYPRLSSTGDYDLTGLSDTQIETLKLKHVLVELLHAHYEANTFLERDDTHETTNLFCALEGEGITEFSSQFLILGSDQIDSLEYEEPVDDGQQITYHLTKLPLGMRNRMKAVIAYFHAQSSLIGGRINILTCNRQHFGDWMVSNFRPENKILVYGSTIAGKSESELAQQFDASIKRNKNDFPELRDTSYWTKFRQKTEAVADAQGLSECFDITGKPISFPVLHERKCNWVYNVLQEKLKAPQAASIVKDFYESKDTKALWKKLITELETSMASDLELQRISGYLTNAKITSFKGLSANFLLQWKEQARLYNERVQSKEEEYTDNQLVTFLHSAVNGDKDLGCLLDQNRAARQAANNKEKIKFEEYVGILMRQAQVKDQRSVADGRRRSANHHQWDYEAYLHGMYDDLDVQDDDFDPFTINVHDFDTSVDPLIVNFANSAKPPRKGFPSSKSSSTGPRRYYLDRATFGALSDEAKSAWHNWSPKDQALLLKYGAEHPDLVKSQAGHVTKSAQPTRANNHEVTFDDVQQEDSTDTANEGTAIEAKTHEIEEKPKSILKNVSAPQPIADPPPRLIGYATNNHIIDPLIDDGQRGQIEYDINTVLSQASKHDVPPLTEKPAYPRPPSSPEHRKPALEISVHEHRRRHKNPPAQRNRGTNVPQGQAQRGNTPHNQVQNTQAPQVPRGNQGQNRPVPPGVRVQPVRIQQDQDTSSVSDASTISIDHSLLHGQLSEQGIARRHRRLLNQSRYVSASNLAQVLQQDATAASGNQDDGTVASGVTMGTTVSRRTTASRPVAGQRLSRSALRRAQAEAAKQRQQLQAASQPPTEVTITNAPQPSPVASPNNQTDQQGGTSQHSPSMASVLGKKVGQYAQAIRSYSASAQAPAPHATGLDDPTDVSETPAPSPETHQVVQGAPAPSPETDQVVPAAPAPSPEIHQVVDPITTPQGDDKIEVTTPQDDDKVEVSSQEDPDAFDSGYFDGVKEPDYGFEIEEEEEVDDLEAPIVQQDAATRALVDLHDTGFDLQE